MRDHKQPLGSPAKRAQANLQRGLADRLTARSLLAGAALSLAALLPALPAHAEPFDEVMQRLLAEHPALAAAAAERRAATAEISGAEAGFLPTVTLSGEAVQEAIDDPEDGQSNLLGRRGEAAARLNVFNGLATTNAVRSAEAARHAALSAEEATAQSLMLEAATAYVSVMQARDVLELVIKETALTGAQIKAAQQLEEQGGGTAIDRLTSYQRHEAARNRLSRARSEMRAALIRYRSVLQGEPDMTVMRLMDPIESSLPGSLEQLTELAVSRHPELSISAAQIDQARAQRRAAGAGHMPSVDIIASTSYEEDLSGTEGDRRDFRVGVEARWEIFSGFATRSAQQAASARLDATRHRERDTRRIVTERARLAWNELILAGEQVSISQELSLAANDFFQSQVTLEDKGRGTRLATLAAEAQSVQTNIDLVRARYQRILAKYGVLAAAGMLNADALSIEQARLIETVSGLDADAANAVELLETSGLAEQAPASLGDLDSTSRGFPGLPPYPARKPAEVIDMEDDEQASEDEAAMLDGPEYAGLSVAEVDALCRHDEGWNALRKALVASLPMTPKPIDLAPAEQTETSNGSQTSQSLSATSENRLEGALTTAPLTVAQAAVAPTPEAAPTVEARAANAIATARRLIAEQEAAKLAVLNGQSETASIEQEAERLAVAGRLLEARIRLLLDRSN